MTTRALAMEESFEVIKNNRLVNIHESIKKTRKMTSSHAKAMLIFIVRDIPWKGGVVLYLEIPDGSLFSALGQFVIDPIDNFLFNNRTASIGQLC